MRVFKLILAGFTAISMNSAMIGTTSIATSAFVFGSSPAKAQVPPRHGYRGGAVRGGPRYAGRGYRGGRGYGRGAAAAAVGLGVLGVLGAAAAANAASQPSAVYEDDCPLVRRRVYLDDGSYVIRRVPAC